MNISHFCMRNSYKILCLFILIWRNFQHVHNSPNKKIQVKWSGKYCTKKSIFRTLQIANYIQGLLHFKVQHTLNLLSRWW